MRSQADLAETLNQLNATITLRALLVPNKEAITTEQQRSGRFILATNVLDAQALSNDDMLRDYIAQQSTLARFSIPQRPAVFHIRVFSSTKRERVAASRDGYGSMLTRLQLGTTNTTSSPETSAHRLSKISWASQLLLLLCVGCFNVSCRFIW